MSLQTLQFAIAEAVQLGGGNLCAVGHDWRSIGGRGCPKDYRDTCGQAVYQCARCGLYDHGEVGGPGHTDCQRGCPGPVDDLEGLVP